MFSFLHRDVPAVGRVLYPGAIPPPLDRLPVFGEPVTWTATAASPGQLWAVAAIHPVWGPAEIACDRHPLPLPEEIIDHSLALTDAEKAQARLGQAAVAVRVRAHQKHVLRDRKRLLFWLKELMLPDGAVAIDGASTLLWSHAMLDDELAHRADLDIEALYTIHAVYDDVPKSDRVFWLHTHGLEQLGAFDFDVLQPSSMLVSNPGEPGRALAFAALEGTIAPDTGLFQLAYPGGEVRFVPVDLFHARAAPEHQQLRTLDSAHSGRRAVICEPLRGLLGRWLTRPEPSRFLSEVDDDRFVFPFSTAATALMAERARQTLDVFANLKAEFASLDLPALVKLGYEVEGGGSSEGEHLWFQVNHLSGDKVDATLVNTPHRVPSLTAGQRGEYELERLTDWTIMSPEGQMTPRSIGAARRLRDSRPMWQARIDAAKQKGS